jgi:hypothetical protein
MMRYFLASVAAITLYLGLNSLGYSTAVLEKPQEGVTSHSSWSEVVEYARSHFPQAGVLVQKTDGYVYLKVDDDYIHKLFPMLGLEEEGYTEPPYFRSKEAPGAHISVIYEAEEVSPEEVGNTYSFTLGDIVIVRPTWDTYYAVIQVKAPELEALRTKYGLQPKLQGHEFHISIAKKKVSNSS